jgi:DNA polymerase III epsilon subunit family exonuclease
MQNRPNTKLELTRPETDALLSIFPDGVVAFDLEMTGLSAIVDKIIEIAAIKLLPSGEVEYFHQLINPLVTIPDETIQYHQITNDMVRDKPTLKKPLLEFKDFYKNLPLIAHNAQFDTSFIVKAHHEYNYDFSLSDIFDSCKFSRATYKKSKEVRPDNFKLSTLAHFFYLDFTHHQALDDAIVCLKVMARCLMENTEIDTKEKLKALAYVYKLNSFQKAADYILPRKFKPIPELIEAKTNIDIMYLSGSLKGQFRPIRPIALLPMPKGLMLYAECLRRKTNKHFRINKIKNFKLTQEENE